MDTDCLQEEISVAPERTAVLSTSSKLTGRDDRDDAGGKEGITHQWRGMEAKDVGADVIPISRIEAAKRSLENAMNGTSVRRGAEGEEERNSQISTEIARLRDTGLTSSPSPSFKSSYAKSLADSYRRASIPVVVSSPKGQFYFKNDEFLSLSASSVRDVDGKCEKLVSLKVNGDSKTAPTQTSKLQSLPPIIDSNEEQLEPENNKKTLDSKLLPTCVYEKLLDEDVFVPFEQLHRLCKEQGGNFYKDLHNLDSIITSDGRKLVNLSDIKLMKSDKPSKTCNGHQLLVNGSEKDTQVEALLVERGQLGDRVDQLCHALADRDGTIQRLEEDLLRIRMECQRLIVDNRSIKSSLGHHGASQTQFIGTDNTSQVSQLQQQVQLLTAQLCKAEQSRHTYEAATRQLVDFLHTVNSTLNNASNLNQNPGSLTTSPTCSLHSSTSTTTKTSSSVHVEADDDPPYRLGRSSTPPPEVVSLRPVLGHGSRSAAESMKKAGSVWVLPTHNYNHQTRKVSRAASTHCVVSASSGCQEDPAAAAAVGAGTSSGSERTRSHTTDFLASRAKELLTSLKSLMRSDSVLKLNLEPKKSGSSVSGGKKSCNRSTNAESKVNTPSGSLADTESSSKTSLALTGSQSSEVQGNRRPTTLSLPGGGEGGVKNCLIPSETNASPTISQNHDTTGTAAAPIPRIGTGKTREDTLQPQSSVVNGNPQPLSLMVVGDPPCNPSDQRFSSLPLRTRITRTLTDAEHRLVWV